GAALPHDAAVVRVHELEGDAEPVLRLADRSAEQPEDLALDRDETGPARFVREERAQLAAQHVRVLGTEALAWVVRDLRELLALHLGDDRVGELAARIDVVARRERVLQGGVRPIEVHPPPTESGT